MRPVRVLVAVGAVCAVGQVGVADAWAFDDWAYSTCTSTTPPGPDGFDAVSSKCCADHGGTPTPTSYGMGCTANVVNPGPDYRPTIYMPTLPAAPGDDGDLTADELAKLPPLPPLPDAPPPDAPPPGMPPPG
jgi:hypothetical protein